jgi:hypothetical protein
MFVNLANAESRYAMAKNQDPKGGGSGKGKMTVVMFQLKGNDETLRDAIKVLGHGMEKLSPGTPIYKMIQAPPQPRANGALPAGDDEEELFDGETIDAEEADTSGASSQNGSSGQKPKKKYIPKPLSAVKGIDWETGTPWKEYAKQKNPTGNPTLRCGGWLV